MYITLREDNVQMRKFIENKTIVSITSAFIVCVLVLLFGIGACTNTARNLDYENQKLVEKYNDLVEDYNELRSTYKKLHTDYNSLVDEHNKLKEEINNYKDQQATITDLTTKLTELHTQYDTLQAERDSLQAQVDAKKAEQERIAQEQAAQQAQQQQANAGGGTVYWVAGGSVYHSTPNCPTLKRSSNIQSGSISQSGKSRACKVCN